MDARAQRGVDVYYRVGHYSKGATIALAHFETVRSRISSVTSPHETNREYIGYTSGEEAREELEALRFYAIKMRFPLHCSPLYRRQQKSLFSRSLRCVKTRRLQAFSSVCGCINIHRRIYNACKFELYSMVYTPPSANAPLAPRLLTIALPRCQKKQHNTSEQKETSKRAASKRGNSFCFGLHLKGKYIYNICEWNCNNIGRFVGIIMYVLCASDCNSLSRQEVPTAWRFQFIIFLIIRFLYMPISFFFVSQ